jgi:hypothetical protein
MKYFKKTNIDFWKEKDSVKCIKVFTQNFSSLVSEKMNHELQNVISGKVDLGMENLSKQLPITLEKAKEQAAWLKMQSTSKKKKQGS